MKSPWQAVSAIRVTQKSCLGSSFRAKMTALLKGPSKSLLIISSGANIMIGTVLMDDGLHVLQKFRYRGPLPSRRVWFWRGNACAPKTPIWRGNARPQGCAVYFLLNGSHNILIHRMCNSEVQCLFGQWLKSSGIKYGLIIANSREVICGWILSIILYLQEYPNSHSKPDVTHRSSNHPEFLPHHDHIS